MTHLDREVADQYNILVTMRDAGQPRLSTPVTITIHVTDVNDNKPEFEPDEYTVRLAHTTPPDTIMALPRVIDADSGLNSDLTFSLITQSTLFKININNGVLTTASDINRAVLINHGVLGNNETEFILLIRATDQGSPSLFGDARVTVIIGHSTRLPGIFQHPYYHVEIPEESPIGKFDRQYIIGIQCY